MARPALSLGRQAVVFVAGGLLSVLIDVGVMQLLIAGGSEPLVATSAGFLCGLGINFAFQARVTFRSATTPAIFGRYLCVVALNYLLTLSLVSAALYWVGSALAGKLVSLPLVALNSFFLSRRWIYR